MAEQRLSYLTEIDSNLTARGASRRVTAAGKMSSDSESEAPRQAFPLLRAAYDGDLHALRRAITEGADVNEQDGYTVLQWLIVHGGRNGADTQLACISALVEAGADVNMKSGPTSGPYSGVATTRSSPIHEAVFSGDGSRCRELVSLLLVP